MRCEDCIYREEGCAGESCSDYIQGDVEDLAEYETDLMDYTGDEDFEDFCEHEDFE